VSFADFEVRNADKTRRMSTFGSAACGRGSDRRQFIRKRALVHLQQGARAVFQHIMHQGSRARTLASSKANARQLLGGLHDAPLGRAAHLRPRGHNERTARCHTFCILHVVFGEDVAPLPGPLSRLAVCSLNPRASKTANLHVATARQTTAARSCERGPLNSRG